MQVAVHEEQVAYLAEHQPRVPGRAITTVTYLRRYNTEALLAHVLGYVGEISPGPAGRRSRSTTGSCAIAAREGG